MLVGFFSPLPFRTELEEAQKELVDVKGLYVDVCEEKNAIQDTVTKTLTAEAAKQLASVRQLNSVCFSQQQPLQSDHCK